MTAALKVGIIGCGTIGRVHADAYRQAENITIAAIADIDPAAAAQEKDRLAIDQAYTDYRDLLKTDVAAVSICTPNACHAEIAIAALQAGKHVLLEKPMAMNATQGQAIVDAAAHAGRVLQIGMVWRQNPAAEIIREYVDKGILGAIYHLRCVLTRRRGIPGLGGWFTTKEQSGGGPMIDLGVHWFDLAMWLSDHWNPKFCSAQNYSMFGPRMKEYRYVSMWAGPPRYDGVFNVEDYTTGLVRFADQATLSFDISWAANTKGECFVEVLGTGGGARIGDGNELTIYTEFEGRVADITPHFDTSGPTGFVKQIRKFAAACRGQGQPPATGAQGVTVMKLLDAIYASSDAGREVAIS